MSKKFDFLTEDTPVPNQDYVCVSFLEAGPNQVEEYIARVQKKTKLPLRDVRKCIQEYTRIEHPRRAVKVRGSYRKQSQARARCKDLRDQEESVNVYIGEVGKWLAFNPAQEELTENVEENYNEVALNDMIGKYKQGRIHAKSQFEQRKRDMMKKAMFEGSEEGQKLMLEKEEPLEAVEHTIQVAQEAKKEFQERIQEAERNIEIYSKKRDLLLEKRDRGETIPQLGDDTSLPVPREFTSSVPDIFTQANISNMRAIEDARVRTDPKSRQEAVQAALKK